MPRAWTIDARFSTVFIAFSIKPMTIYLKIISLWHALSSFESLENLPLVLSIILFLGAATYFRTLSTDFSKVM